MHLGRCEHNVVDDASSYSGAPTTHLAHIQVLNYMFNTLYDEAADKVYVTIRLVMSFLID